MIRCIAIDDEPLALEQLKIYISKVPYLSLVAACHDAYEAMQALETSGVDVIFADINMPDLNGLEFIRSLSSPPMVVFTTAYAAYAVESYKVSAVDYLLKPFSFEEFLNSADKVRRQFELVNGNAPHATQDDFIYVKADHRMHRIAVSSIMYIEGMAEYVRIYVDGTRKPYTALFSMKKMEEVLGGDKFLRVHKSYIVNMAVVQAVSKTSIQLDDTTFIPIGDTYRASVVSYVDERAIGK